MSRVLVAGALANKPRNGGEAWVRLSWLRGLERLGLDVWFVEQAEDAANADWFESVVERFGFGGRSALVTPDGRALAGASTDTMRDAAAGADLLLNISGNLSGSLLGLPRRRAYVDLDPGYTQFWHAQGALGGIIERHEAFLTVALAIGTESCSIPTGGLAWRPVPPPVVLADWPVAADDGVSRLTTIGSWRGGYGRVEHDGRSYGQKAHEFRRFLGLPDWVDARLEVALDIHPGDRADVERLQDAGWELVDPDAVAGDPESFRRYVQGSGAEFSPAQGIYVETGSGWFSDRTTRYLASGKPAVVQNTGVPSAIPCGEGLLSFRTTEEAAAAIEDVLANYDRHATAARRIAEEHFSAEVVLTSLMEDLIP